MQLSHSKYYSIKQIVTFSISLTKTMLSSIKNYKGPQFQNELGPQIRIRPTVQEPRQMLCGSFIKIWNLANRMKNKTKGNIDEKLKIKCRIFFFHVICNNVSRKAFGASFLYWVDFNLTDTIACLSFSSVICCKIFFWSSRDWDQSSLTLTTDTQWCFFSISQILKKNIIGCP